MTKEEAAKLFEAQPQKSVLTIDDRACRKTRLVEFFPYLTGAKLPTYATHLSSGMDLCACLGSGKVKTIYPNQTLIIETGLKCKIHPMMEGQVRSRSGLAIKNGIIVLNAPGTVDAGLRVADRLAALPVVF